MSFLLQNNQTYFFDDLRRLLESIFTLLNEQMLALNPTANQLNENAAEFLKKNGLKLVVILKFLQRILKIRCTSRTAALELYLSEILHNVITPIANLLKDNVTLSRLIQNGILIINSDLATIEQDWSGAMDSIANH